MKNARTVWLLVVVLGIVIGGAMVADPVRAEGRVNVEEEEDDDGDDPDCSDPEGCGVICVNTGGRGTECPFDDTGGNATQDFYAVRDCINQNLGNTFLGPNDDFHTAPYGETAVDYWHGDPTYTFDSACMREESLIRMVDLELDEEDLVAKIRRVSETPDGGSIKIKLNETDVVVTTTAGQGLFAVNNAIKNALIAANFEVTMGSKYIVVDRDNNVTGGQSFKRVRFWSEDTGITVGEVVLDIDDSGSTLSECDGMNPGV